MTPEEAGPAAPRDEAQGLLPLRRATFNFRASRNGVYRFACLVPGHMAARMWDVLKIVRHGKPSVVDLQTK